LAEFTQPELGCVMHFSAYFVAAFNATGTISHCSDATKEHHRSSPAALFRSDRYHPRIDDNCLDEEKMMKLKTLVFATAFVGAFSLMGAVSWAFDASSLPESKQTDAKLYLGAEEVPDFLKSQNGKVLFIDVRTPAEVMFVGNTPLMDANVPFKVGPTNTFDDKKGVLTLAPNPNFVAQVEARLTAKSLTKADTVVLMCRSGDRSAAAANVLIDAGFTKVYSVADGFEGDLAKDGPNAGRRAVNGWKNKGQPWGYTVDKAKLTLTETK
jgi:rhodanese-related sulfurtransferase